MFDTNSSPVAADTELPMFDEACDEFSDMKLLTRDAGAGAMAEGQPDPWDQPGHFYKESVLPIKTRSF